MFLYRIVISTIYIDIDIVKNILLYYSVYFASHWFTSLNIVFTSFSTLLWLTFLFTLFADLHYFVSLYISFAVLLYFILHYYTLIYTLHFTFLFLPFLYSESTLISFSSLSHFSKDLGSLLRAFHVSMISSFNNLGLENNGLVDKCAVYKATRKLSVQTSCGFQWLSRELLRKIKKLIKASQKKNFEKNVHF